MTDQKDRSDESKREALVEVIGRINAAWLACRVEDMVPFLDPGIVMVFPGFTESMQGRDAFINGFRDFCENAKVHDYTEHDHHVDVIADTAVVTFGYKMLYERSGQRYRSTGQDFWIFRKREDCWLAVWRTMLGIVEEPA
jgi:ketosteroid isomerase-like protein